MINLITASQARLLAKNVVLYLSPDYSEEEIKKVVGEKIVEICGNSILLCWYIKDTVLDDVL